MRSYALLFGHRHSMTNYCNLCLTMKKRLHDSRNHPEEHSLKRGEISM